MQQVMLEPVAFEQKAILRRLLQLYLHDMSEFTADDMDEHGEFGYRYFDHYWAPDAGEERHPLLIRAGNAIAGFALVRRVGDEWQMAEFFVMRRFRRSGVGSAAARAVFQRFPGRWFVHQLAANLPAQVFWPRVIGQFTGDQFESGADEDGTWQRFVV
jgi:predicted acetyltransferase